MATDAEMAGTVDTLPAGVDDDGYLDEAVAKLLFPEADQNPGTGEPADSDEPGTAPDEADKAAKPVPGTALKDALGKDANYWAMTVPVGDDGESVTIEALKDAYTQRKRTEREAQELDSQRGEWRAEEYRQRRDLQMAIQALQQPGGLNRDNVERLQTLQRNWVEREQNLVKQVAPDALTDQAAESLARHAARYGASRQEVGQVREAAGWVQLIMHDWAVMQERKAEIQSKASKPQPKAQKPQAGKVKPPSAKDAYARGELSYEQATERLLFGS